MSTVSIRIPVHTHTKLRELASAQQKAISDVLSAAVEAYQQDQFWKEAETAYARLNADPEAWQEWQREIDRFDSTVADGLGTYPYDAGTGSQDAGC